MFVKATALVLLQRTRTVEERPVLHWSRPKPATSQKSSTAPSPNGALGPDVARTVGSGNYRGHAVW